MKFIYLFFTGKKDMSSQKMYMTAHSHFITFYPIDFSYV